MKFKKIPRTLVVVDFDDTLVQTDAKIRVTNRNLELSTLEFGKYKRESDDVFDLSDFRTGKLKNPRTTEFFETTFQNILAGQTEIIILTARPQTYAKEIEDFLAPYISPDRLTVVGGAQSPELKKREIEKHLDEFDFIRFYDDSESNIAAVNSLRSPKIKTILVKN